MQCDIRCTHCNKLLRKGCFEWLEIKCPRCGSMENIQIECKKSGLEDQSPKYVKYNIEKKA